MEIYRIDWGSNTYYIKAKTPLDAWRILLKKSHSKLSAEKCQYNNSAIVISVMED